MPAPPEESEPAMVKAIGVISPSPAPLERVVDRLAQGASGGGRVWRERQSRNDGDAVGAGVDDVPGIGGGDAGNGADRVIRLARADGGRDRAQAASADRRRGVVLRRGRIDAAD